MTLAEIVRYAIRESGLKRWILPLPDALGRVLAFVGDFIPGKPISSDNFKSLKIDSIGTSNGLAALGIKPTPIAAIMPFVLRGGRKQTQLDRYRGSARG
jgi:NADH dehydrogenase